MMTVMCHLFISRKQNDSTHDTVDDNEGCALKVITLAILEDVVHQNSREKRGECVHVWEHERKMVSCVFALEKKFRNENENRHLQQAHLKTERKKSM